MYFLFTKFVNKQKKIHRGQTRPRKDIFEPLNKVSLPLCESCLAWKVRRKHFGKAVTAAHH